MLLSKTVILKWNSKIKKHYESLGYTYTKMKDEFEVNVSDLTRGSAVIVDVECDYCHTKYQKVWNRYLTENRNSHIHKDCCNKCKKYKCQESNMDKYGVKSVLSLSEIKNKIALTNLEKYGAENPFSNEEIKAKIRETNFEKYGCDSYTKSQSDDKYVIKDNLDQTISTASTTNAPSTKAVYDALEDLSDTVEGNYVKLVSESVQTIESELIIDTGFNRVSLTDSTFASDSYYDLIAGNTSGSTFVKVKLESTYGQYIIYLGSDNKAFALEKTGNINSVIGTHVASYQDATHGGTLTDGRLVTVDYLNAFTGDMGAYAKLSAENNFTGNTNTFKGVSATSYTGTGVYSSYSSGSGTGGWDNSGSNSKLPTVASVRSAITDAKNAVLNTISSSDTIGSIGLFIYSEIGAEKGYGDTVDGQFLKAAAISLPMSGQISYKAVGLPMSGTWTLLSGAFKRTTATEPCLVLAQKISTQ